MSPSRSISADAITRTAFPNSTKVYVEGSRPDIRVPMREIALAPTVSGATREENPAVTVYDTSGPYTDPDARMLVSEKEGEGRHVTAWIDEFAAANRMPSCASPTDA